MTANRRSVRKRRSKHKGSMKIITLIVLVLCGVFGVFTWQNTQKSEQYALVQENLQQQIDDEEEIRKRLKSRLNTRRQMLILRIWPGRSWDWFMKMRLFSRRSNRE